MLLSGPNWISRIYAVAEEGSKYISEKSASDVIVRHSDLLGQLVYICPDSNRAKKKSDPWDAKKVTKCLRYILDRFREVLKLPMFSPDNAQNLYSEKAAVDEEYKAVHSQLESQLPALARLHMLTIGSSHRISTQKKTNSDGDLAHIWANDAQ